MQWKWRCRKAPTQVQSVVGVAVAVAVAVAVSALCCGCGCSKGGEGRRGRTGGNECGAGSWHQGVWREREVGQGRAVNVELALEAARVKQSLSHGR